jgi:phosphatidate cytidylyltransferase
MLRTRLWVGALLVIVAGGGLVIDQWFAPYYPIVFALVLALSLAGGAELIRLLGAIGRPAPWLCYAGLILVIAANWPAHLPVTALPGVGPWWWVAAAFAGFVLAAFVVEMAIVEAPGTSVLRIALAVWLVAYLGLLPSFLAQVRWLGERGTDGLMALLLAIFVPKCADIGAYCTGRLIGRHPMTPLLSPKKTWEGAAGGLVFAVAAAVALDRLGPAPMLRHDVRMELGFGVTLAVAGMLGDLAESLIKRDVRQKDASQAVPGFGGVLDVVDALLFAGPVAYVWFTITTWTPR